MRLKSIKLNNFRCFEGEHEYFFDNINLVQGNNGTGKSTLILDSLLFVSYGYSEKSLEELPTRGKASKCSVEAEIEHIKDNYIIKREYPTKVTITKNGQELEITNNKEKQNYLNSIFKSVDYFKKFRMIDNTIGINILESNKREITKSLFSFHENIVNKIRINLLKEKRIKDIYNRDNLKTDPHYPSEKRLKVLKDSINKIEIDEKKTALTIKAEKNSYYHGSFRETIKLNTEKNDILKRIDDIVLNDICPFCSQEIKEEYKKEILGKSNSTVKQITIQLKNLEGISKFKEAQISKFEITENKNRKKKLKLSVLQEKLSNRLKQKDYIYTTKDSILIKEAVSYLDKFISYYMSEWLKHIEPIINSIINQIGFKINFILNDKQEFDFVLIKTEKEYRYKDLSNGEKLILSMAFQLSLLLEKNETGLIIADEGFSSLDEDNLNLILELFKNLPFQLICVIHRANNININLNVIDLNKGD